MRTLPNGQRILRLNDLRRNHRALANELLASLTPSQLHLVDTVAHGGTVFGGPDSPRIVVCRTRKDDGDVIEDGMTDVNALVRHGWLRFARMTGEGSGWFWLTDATERLWGVLGR